MKQDKHELLYNSTADSLRKYGSVASDENFDALLKDYTELEYSAYRKKYGLGEEEMDQLAATLK